MKKEKECRRVKSISPMAYVIPYIMVDRTGSQNFIQDSVDIEKLEKYMKEKQQGGMTNISMMHIMIAAYIRLVSQRPALNRFIRGQKVWTRKNVEVSLTIKKEMSLESPDTVVKITLPPSATLADVYEALNHEIVSYRENPGGDFDNTARFFTKFPGLLFKFTVAFLRFLDYFSLMPKFIAKVSPFHCSYFITSMGSLGIPPIYHHLYDFGTCPVFFSFGAKRRAYELDSQGIVKKKSYMDFTFVLDERICDGYYYASALRHLKNIIKNPWQLDNPPETVVEDIE
ncbi:MAG: hypothetical protein J6I42_04200 [Clostridia bacterium]|nr:hypothetical protein [Oscillospiraceae bacterium]MBO4931365.1 hypothetical protein [Clostridia bacterium]MBO5255873.1 hypothetical protein [Clostridia bacterium]